MALKQVLEVWEALDSARADGDRVRRLFAHREVEVQVESVAGQRGSTDFVRLRIPGSRADAPVLGIIGRHGGVGARPAKLGLVSDADGAMTALAAGLKLADMALEGDQPPGDVLVATHVCPSAPIIPHEPVPFMNSPVDMATMNRHEVSPQMSAILSVDTTRGNRVVNQRGVAITPTVKEGFLLPPSPDLLDLLSWVTGRPPLVVPLATQDVTPYGNGLDHINSIVQPATVTSAPVVGVALTAEVAVPGSASGASQVSDVEAATRFCVEVAKAYGSGACAFYDPQAFGRLLSLYGPMTHLQPLPEEAGG